MALLGPAKCPHCGADMPRADATTVCIQCRRSLAEAKVPPPDIDLPPAPEFGPPPEQQPSDSANRGRSRPRDEVDEFVDDVQFFVGGPLESEVRSGCPGCGCGCVVPAVAVCLTGLLGWLLSAGQ